jgi:hypothetical protein
MDLACLSRGETRIFVARAEYRSGTGARITGPPAAKPHRLYEFFAEDIDGNIFRAFYDFAWEENQTPEATALASTTP